MTKYFRVFLAVAFMVFIPRIGGTQETPDQVDENIIVVDQVKTAEKDAVIQNDEDQNVEEVKIEEMEEDIDNEVDDKEEAQESEETESNEEMKGAEKKSVQTRVVNMDQLITLDLRNMDVSDALMYLSLRSGANIVASKTVTGRVTLQLKDVPLRDVFDITLLTNNLAYEQRGDIYYVMTEPEYEARYGRSFGDIRKVKMYQLKYAIPEKAFDLLDTLKSKIGRILVDQESGTVLMVDTEEKLEEMENALVTLEQKSDVTIFNLQYALAQDVEERLRSQIDEKSIGTIWSDERSNQVVVQAFAGRMDGIKEIIAALDQKTKEVLIDAKIIKVVLSDELSTGFEWEGFFSDLAGHTGFLGSHPFEPIERYGVTAIDDFTTIQPEDNNPLAGAKSTFTERIFLGKTSKNTTFEILFKFLSTLGEARLLSNPKLAVINNQEARIHVGRKEAYITTTTTAGSTTTTTAEDVNFVDIGIQLSVTPTINDDGFVTMKVKPEVSSVVDTLVTPSGNQIPIIDTSLAESTVMVQDNSTIIIGGLRRDLETEVSERIPFLGDIPFFGNLFKSQVKSRERSELLVLITPHIVDGTLVMTGETNPGEEGNKTFKDYKTFEPVEDDDYGPEFGKLEYKTFRD